MFTGQKTPRDLVAALEARPALPAHGDADRFAGYGVLGVYFSSGDVLALRRFPATSVGPGYVSVWHRDRTGTWVFYQDTLPHQGCTRYFSEGIDAAYVSPIRLVWAAAFSFTVIVSHGRGLEWRVDLAASRGARLLGAVTARLPRRLWQSRAALRGFGVVAGVALRAGRLRLEGSTPNTYRFLAHPVSLWRVSSSRAVIGGRATGEAIEPAEQVRLGDFWVPARGLFALVDVEMTRRPCRSGKA
jgi:hypothetical protein